MADPSFDVVSKVDRQEVDNALNQAAKELSQRFDFRGTKASIAWAGEEAVALQADTEERVAAPGGLQGEADQAQHLAEGPGRRRAAGVGQDLQDLGARSSRASSSEAKKIAKLIRDEGPRASRRRSRATSCGSAARRGTTCRRCSAAAGADLDLPLQFDNYRSSRPARASADRTGGRGRRVRLGAPGALVSTVGVPAFGGRGRRRRSGCHRSRRCARRRPAPGDAGPCPAS